MKKLLLFIAIFSSLLLTSNILEAQVCGGVCSGFRTQTQGGWGANPNGGNPGVYLHANFAAAFPGGLTIGCAGRSVSLTTAQAITNVLPAGSGPALLPVGNQINPASLNTVLAGQLISAKLSVGFDQYDANFGINTSSLGSLVYNSGTFSGKTVQFVINEADKAIGNCGSSYSLSDLNDALDQLNNNYDDGTAGAGQGHFNCPSSVPVVADITGTLTACIGLTTNLSDVTASGVWSTNNALIATVSNAGVVTGVAAGTATISYTVTNVCGSAAKTAAVVITDCGGVPGGGGGGLESKSLGDAVAKRLINNAVNNLLGPVEYNKMTVFERGTIRNNATGLGTSLTLSDILPQKIGVNNLTAFISTPKDIPSITNAKDVLSIDYAINNQAKAVAFATKTFGEVYDHTKAICDRLKGSELMGLQQVMINGMKLVRFDLKNASGQMEYSMSFVIGAKTGRANYTLQSNWLNKNYSADEVMYNVQVWAVTPAIVESMVADIITRLSTNMPVKAVVNTVELPKTYITKGNHVSKNMVLNINNSTTATSGYFEIIEKANEQSGTTTRQVPFTVAANGLSSINVGAGDSYESTINLFMNGVMQDQVFIADGNWGVNYNNSTSTLNKFQVTNNSNLAVENADDFVLFRNVQVDANTPDYVTLYKTLRGGAAKQDLTGFKTLQMTAAGTGANVRVTLVKEGITNWADQYSTVIVLGANKQDYKLNLSDFKSGNSLVKINPNDITAVVFSLESVTGKMVKITADISSVKFSKTDFAYLNSLNSKELNSYPNPSNGKFNVTFKAASVTPVTLFMTEVSTGRTIYSKQVTTQIGDNTVPMAIDRKQGMTQYILSMEGKDIKYTPKSVLVDQR